MDFHLSPTYSAYLSALGIGLLIGVVRERQRGPGKLSAGMRTHTLAALGGVIGWQLGLPVFLVTLAAITALAYAGYQKGEPNSPGLTGEIALLLTTLLGGLAHHSPGLATALAVLIAILLQGKDRLHRLGRELISEHEVQDGLLLLGAALLVLPLLPSEPIDPYGVLKLAKLWQLVVLVMAISAVGHVALRVVGGRWGLPLAGFFAGFVSSTAAIAGFGQRVRETPELRTPSVAAAMFAALASLLLMLPVIATVSPLFLKVALPQLLAFGAVLAVGGLLGLKFADGNGHSAMPTAESRMFRMSHALIFAALIAGVLLLSAWLQDVLGDGGALITAAIAALIELHAAGASVAQMGASGSFSTEVAQWALLGVFAASVVSRSIVAFVAGGQPYGLRVSIGLSGALIASALTIVIL